MEDKKDEKKEEEGKKPEAPEEDSGDGDNSKTHSLIEQANSAAERLEKANKVQEELIRKEEELQARRRLGGETTGNQKPEKEIDPKERAKKYADSVMKGKLPDGEQS